VSKASRAFTMLEMMVVLFLIGIIAALFAPRLTRRSPASDWKNVLDDINNLVSFTRQEAISNYKIYRLVFKTRKNKPDLVIVEEETDDEEKPDKKIYKQADFSFISAKLALNEIVKINGVYHGKEETMESNKGQGYCHVIPNGLVQDVSIHLTRFEDGGQDKATFRMSPFFGRFEYIEGHVRPG
jgi:prepilin-type N-terminal cleavage/methylation domain-containing protein